MMNFSIYLFIFESEPHKTLIANHLIASVDNKTKIHSPLKKTRLNYTPFNNI